SKVRNLLAANTLTVHHEFHFVQVRVNPDWNLVAFSAVPVPVREQMQRGLLAPPRFVIVKVVLRETAHVQNAELRVNRGPAIGGWLTTIVETSPGEPARFPIL